MGSVNVMLTLDLTGERIGVCQCSKCMYETERDREMTLHASIASWVTRRAIVIL